MIIFCDFDGTLWRHSDTDFSELNQNIATIQNWRSAGNLFVIASGRSLASLKRHQANFTDYTDFFISDNGAFIFDQNQQVVIQNTLSDAQSAKILATAQQTLPADQFRVSFYSAYDESEQITAELGKIRIWFKSADAIDLVTEKLHAALPGQLKIHHERHAIKSSLPWVDNTFTAFINVVSKTAGKESAITQLLQKLHLSTDEAFSIGDDLNDLEMLKHFHGHTLSDAHPQLRALISPQNQRRTVADFIKSLMPTA